MPARGDPARVSIILPVHNAEPWLDECLRSVLQQDFEGSMELSVFNDASKDKSMTIVEKWKEKLEGSGILVVIGGHDSPSPRGVGYSKNQAVAQSSGPYLCFLDSDDVMMPQRVRLQHEAAVRCPASIIGCRVSREPPGSTERYTRWVNQLEPHQLLAQVFTSNGPTVIMPTWFCSRAWFSHVGPFDEGGRGVPEDLLFFYNHLRKGGGVIRVDQSLLLYRYHPHAATHAVLETTMWTHRVRFLEERVLPHWAAFTIWNAGRQGRWLYRSLTDRARHKEKPKPRVPILHFRAARPPFVICVKLGYTPTRPTLRRSGTWTPSAAEVSGFCAGPQVQLRGSRPRRERVCEQADPEDGVCKDIHSEPHAAWAVLRPGPAEAGVVAVCAGCWLAVMQAWLAKLTRKGLRDSGCR
ncbi:queuosine-tRNA galactosyltransferase isoform X9 [Manis javanica]|uniref:queuosine-tRNA galactosyltransferase isoform X9 n=1 Tax=Manis javanica TaxID=9974 RepID=UPI003C6D3AC6